VDFRFLSSDTRAGPALNSTPRIATMVTV